MHASHDERSQRAKATMKEEARSGRNKARSSPANWASSCGRLMHEDAIVVSCDRMRSPAASCRLVCLNLLRVWCMMRVVLWLEVDNRENRKM